MSAAFRFGDPADPEPTVVRCGDTRARDVRESFEL
jgi:hypothetical protein